MKFQLKDVLPNPHRDLKRNPPAAAKVDALVKSINSTTFWENVVGRKTSDGKLELAYGHTRLAALKTVYKPTDEFNFIVRDLSDAMMLKIMFSENDEVYGNDLRAVVESVRATVIALAEGKISSGIVTHDGAAQSKLDMAIPEKTNRQHLRFAPSFVAGRASSGSGPEHPYTALSIATFLESLLPSGDVPDKIDAAFRWLEAAERGITTPAITSFQRSTEAIPAKAFLKATQEAVFKSELARQRETEKAKEAARIGESLKETLARANKEAEARKAELKKKSDQILEATKKDDEDKVTRLKKEMIEKKEADKVAETKRLQAEKEWKANDKARKDSIENQRAEKARAEVRAEASRANYVMTLSNSIGVRGTSEDPLYEQLKCVGRDKRTIDAERTALINELEELSERVLQMRVFIRPELGKKR